MKHEGLKMQQWKIFFKKFILLTLLLNSFKIIWYIKDVLITVKKKCNCLELFVVKNNLGFFFEGQH